MSQGLYSHTTRATGTVLTAAIYNSDHQNHITNQNPSMSGAYSDNLTQHQLNTDPGGLGTEVLATDMGVELEQLRFCIKRITGAAQWYIGAVSSLGAIQGAAIVDGTVSDAELAANSVITSKILDANVTTAKLANDAVDNAKLNNMAAWSFKIRNAGSSGDPSDAALADVTTEAVAAAGQFLVGFLASGEIRKFEMADVVGGGWSVTVKTADETVSNTTTLQDDDHLFFAVAANKTYSFRFQIWYKGHDTTNFKWQLTGPAAPTLMRAAGKTTLMTDPAGLVSTAFQNVARQHAFSQPVTTGAINATSTEGWLEIEGLLQNGANAGNVRFQFAQGIAQVQNCTVYKGSYVEFIETT